MAQDRTVLSAADVERIYDRLIRPDILGDLPRSPRPTAVIVAGKPGAGKTYTAARIQAHLATSVGVSVVISGDELREYHPGWNAGADATSVDATREAVSRWYARLSEDVSAQGVNAVFRSTLRQPRAALVLTSLLRRHGYDLSAVVLATHREQSRQTTMARFDLARASGAAAPFVSAASHDTAYDQLRESLGRLEAERAVDRIQVVAPDGRQLYANEVDGQRWIRDPKAVSVLDDFRERRLTARELADIALRWQTLVQRFVSDPSVPRQVASQAAAWRNQATALAEGDPEAAQMMTWGREAEAFRTLERGLFLREFPHHAKAVDRLEEAIRYAQGNFQLDTDRERFVVQARERLAERIGEGRFAAKPPTRERGSKAR